MRRGLPGRAGESVCALDRPHDAPIIRGTLYARRLVGEPEKVRRPEFSVARTSPFRDFDKPKRHAFPDSWADRVSVNSIFVEVLIGTRQLAVVLAAMVRKLEVSNRAQAGIEATRLGISTPP